MQKSEIIPVGDTKDMERAVAIFGCKVGKLPTSYLGLPLRTSHKSCGVRDVMEERFKRKLVAWKNNTCLKKEDLSLLSALFQTSRSILCRFL